MRARIEQQRSEITHTVDQIGNRVNPSHIVARRQDRARRRLWEWRDMVFGNDEPDYPDRRNDRYRFPAANEHDTALRERVGDAASTASTTMQQAPTAMRRQTRGNPMAAGAIAMGAGWLIGGLLPESRTERRSLERMEPRLTDAVAEARDEARGLAEDLREPARDAAEQVEEAGRRAAEDLKGQRKDSGPGVGRTR